MRNHDYKSDQKVFTFINSEECRSYSDFTTFLWKNNLPLYERWAYYFLGKKNWISEQSIAEMEYNGYTQYGAYIFSDIYYWKDFLRNDYEKNERERIKIEINSKNAFTEEVSKIFCEKGWDYVSDRSNTDQEIEKADRDYDDDLEISSDRESDNDNYCAACDSSPCMCSDNDRF